MLSVLEASDEDGDNLIIRFPDFDTEAQTLVSINQTNFGPGYAAASIILQQKLDRDYVSSYCQHNIQKKLIFEKDELISIKYAVYMLRIM